MDPLLYGSPSCLHQRELPGTTRSSKPNKKYQCNCFATEQEESLFLPIEIMIEIFCRLDARSLLKFKSVCKQWRAMIEDPNFVEEHASRDPFMGHYKRMGYSKRKRDIIGQEVQVISTINGLLLERVVGNGSKRKHRVRNPTLRRVFDLPDPREHIIFMEIFHVPSDCYKLVSVHRQKDDDLTLGADVLTLGSADEPTWRFIDATLLRNLFKRYGRSVEMLCFKGVVHFNPISGLGSKDYEVVSLDMDKECFTSTMLPRSFYSDSQVTIGYQDHHNVRHLSLAEIVNDELCLLVLEDYKKGKWAEEKITIPLTFLKENSNMKGAQPCWASPWYVLLSVNGETVRYSIKTKEMITAKANRRAQGKKPSCIFQETLVLFRGMRSEEN